MIRRDLVAQLALFPFFPRLRRFQADDFSARNHHVEHRVRPSDPEWPSMREWGILNQATGGHLTKAKSPLWPCDGNAKSATCNAVLADLKNPFYVGD